MPNGYVVVIEGDDDSGYGSYSPDLPGVIATASTYEECETLMREAIPFHIEGLVEAGDSVPEPTNPAGVLIVDPSTA